jgi:hypothetical protein
MQNSDGCCVGIILEHGMDSNSKRDSEEGTEEMVIVIDG